MGPRGPSFWVLMPISAPSPNCAPSVKLVGAFQYTQAASTDCWNRRAAASSDVTIASLCPEPESRMCSKASSMVSTVRIAIYIAMNSVPKLSAVAGWSKETG